MKRILVVGGGLIGVRHVQMVQEHPDCELAGLVDPDTSKHIGNVPCFREMSAVEGKVDGAILATPNSLHADQGIEAAERGWDILVEKPVADTLENAQRLAAVVKQTGVASLVGHHRRYHASLQNLKSLIQTGSIGDVITATLIWAVKKPDSYFQDNWRAGEGSPVIINLVHDVDVLRFVLGEIESVSGFGSNAIRGADRIESGAVAMRMDSGATVAISFADTAPSPWGFEAGTIENPNIAGTGQDMLWITGSHGSVSFPSMTVWTGSDDWSLAPTPKQQHAETVIPLRAQLDHFIDVMHRRAEPLINIEDATQTLAATLDLQKALSL